MAIVIDHEGNFNDVMCLVIARYKRRWWVQISSQKSRSSAGLGIHAACFSLAYSYIVSESSYAGPR